jgi:hypothetical protein
MDNLDRSYRCNICIKTYSSYKSLWNHNNKFHKINDTIDTKNDTIDIKNNTKIIKYKFCDFFYQLFFLFKFII